MIHLFEFSIGFFSGLGLGLILVLIGNYWSIKKTNELWESED
jgi:hypothetical protein